MILVIKDIVNVSLSYRILTVIDDNIFCASRRTVIQHGILQMKLIAFTL